MNESFTDMRSLLGALAEAMNLIDPRIENHHKRTAYLAYMIARETGIAGDELEYTIYAALLHDIGSISDETPRTIAEIEREAKKYSYIGSRILSEVSGTEPVCRIIRRCQRSWAENRRELGELPGETERTLLIASVIHLADVVSTIVCQDVPVLDQVREIREGLNAYRGTEFAPEAVDAFLNVSGREFVWLDFRYNPQFLMVFTGDLHEVSLDRAVELTQFVSRIIDYRSAFTAMHSAGVAASAVALASLSGMSAEECKMMRIAGHLHDVGKLKIPREILEKPGKLTDSEFNVMKEHPYFTRLILMNVRGFDRIANWAGFHHEKLNGHGYPFHFGASDLDLGSRIVAVADVFSAITERRPYREGMQKPEVLKVLDENVASGGIDGDVVSLLKRNYDEIDRLRDETSRREGARYYASIA